MNNCVDFDELEIDRLINRIGEVHLAIARAIGRVQRWKASSEHTGGSFVTMHSEQGYRESRIERAITEADAERWGITELKTERDTLIAKIEPYIRLLPAGQLRAVASMRFIEGLSCIAIGKTLHYSRCHIYKIANTVMDRMRELERGHHVGGS